MRSRIKQWLGRWWTVVLGALIVVGTVLEVVFEHTKGSALLILAVAVPIGLGVAALSRFAAAGAIAIYLLSALAALADIKAVYSSDVLGLGALAGAAAFGTLRSGRDRLLGLVLIVAVVSAVILRTPQEVIDEGEVGRVELLVSQLIVFALAWGIAWAISTRVRAVRALRERARTLEAERDATARAAVAEERSRIARELHDVVAHSVSVMTVQAGGVRRLLGPEQTRERDALAAIEATGRQALAEMRRMVGVMRTDPDLADLAPQPGLAGLGRLIDELRVAGLPVDLQVAGEPRQLQPGLDLAAFRIVQEGLTNTLKHAGPAHAWVRLRHEADALEIMVEDDGRGAANGAAGGHGLIGIRERVAIYGGTFESGPRPGGGYRLSARLPVAADGGGG